MGEQNTQHCLEETKVFASVRRRLISVVVPGVPRARASTSGSSESVYLLAPRAYSWRGDRVGLWWVGVWAESRSAWQRRAHASSPPPTRFHFKKAETSRAPQSVYSEPSGGTWRRAYSKSGPTWRNLSVSARTKHSLPQRGLDATKLPATSPVSS